MQIRERLKRTLKKFPFLYSAAYWIYRGGILLSDDRLKEIIKETLETRPSVFFVQVGSNDGVKADPLRDFIVRDNRWAGIFIEPLREPFERLKANYESQDRFIFENVAIAASRTQQKFYFFPASIQQECNLPYWADQVGSFDRSHVIKHFPEFASYIAEQEVDCVPLADILIRNMVQQVEVIHIDAEGFDYDVLAQIDFKRYKPRVVFYEHTHLSLLKRLKARFILWRSGYTLRYGTYDTLAVKSDTIL